MKKGTAILTIIFLSFILCQCKIKKQDKVVKETTFNYVDDKNGTQNNEFKSMNQKAWEEANKCKALITDKTFLQTRGKMSDSAIDPLTGKGWNKDYAFNQVIYLKALERARKHLSVNDNRFIFDLKSGAEFNVSEDIYQYIINVFKNWNLWVEKGEYKIIKAEDGYYNISPLIK